MLPSEEQIIEQAKRAEALRKRIEELGSGEAHKTPRTPREFTDDAAREEWLKEQRKEHEK